MINKEIALLLREIAATYIIRGDREESRFKVVAYEKAADSIEHLSSDLEDIWREGKLREIPGIGPSISLYLSELLTKGKVKHFEELKKGLPKAMFTLLRLPGFGAKKAYKLARLLKIKDNEDAILKLKEAAQKHKIAVIPGFGEKSEREIIESINSFFKKEAKLSRMLLPYADEIAIKVVNYLKQSKYVVDARPLGSLRRMMATVGDIDIAVSSERPHQVIDHFVKFPETKKVIEKGEVTSSIVLRSGVQIDLMIQSSRSFGSLLQHFTGSKQHNIKLRELALKKGLSLSEYGMKTIKKIKNEKLKMKNYNKKLKIYEFATEEEFYKALGLTWIPPELRENLGEIEEAQKSKLPQLVKIEDVKGDLHLHSNYDLEPSHDLGANSYEEIIEKAKLFGYQYIGFSEHNPSINNHSSNQIIHILKRRKEVIDKLKYSTKNTRVNLFIMLEVDILANGKLAIPEPAFEYLDAVIVSIHSSFNMPTEKMTERILTALKEPKVKILGHPTARLLEKRESINVDWPVVFDFCKKHNKALEINAYPQRLDLPDVLVREALKNGNKFVINTDAHAVTEMDLMKYGVAVARRGWLNKNDILNSLGYIDFKKWLLGK